MVMVLCLLPYFRPKGNKKKAASIERLYSFQKGADPTVCPSLNFGYPITFSFDTITIIEVNLLFTILSNEHNMSRLLLR